MTGYAYHYHKAREEFQKWFYKHHPNDAMKQLFEIMPENMREFDDEFKFAMESFEECEQIKIIFHYEAGEHYLKVKWEHSPWWENQVLHFYYCVLYPIDQVTMQFPHEIVKDEEE
jgi:hypothetical protein